MKIISGKYKGRILRGFDIDGTRPTMDRVKESLFGMIQDNIRDATVLDLYAGTGNLGIEALSNGAKKAYFVDNNKIAINRINENLKLLNIHNADVKMGSAINELNNLNGKVSFDVVFLDPPYQTNEIDKSLSFFNNNTSLIKENGIIVCETEIDIDYSRYDSFKIYKMRKYGSKTITILENNL